MKLYLIKFNEFMYEQYDGFVFAAENEASVLEYLHNNYGSAINWNHGYTIKELNPNDYSELTVILDSFNAG